MLGLLELKGGWFGVVGSGLDGMEDVDDGLDRLEDDGVGGGAG